MNAHLSIYVHTIKSCAINWQKALSRIKGICQQPLFFFVFCSSHWTSTPYIPDTIYDICQQGFLIFGCCCVVSFFWLLAAVPADSSNVSAIRPRKRSKTSHGISQYYSRWSFSRLIENQLFGHRSPYYSWRWWWWWCCVFLIDFPDDADRRNPVGTHTSSSSH